MARKRTINIGCLNVVLHPHSPNDYLDLLDHASEQPSVQIGDNIFTRIRHILPLDGEDPQNGVRGKIYRHLQLSEKDDWLNDDTDQVAQPEEIQGLIPDHLLPGLSEFEFVFYPDGHRLFFSMKSDKGKSLGPKSAEKIIFRILHNALLTKDPSATVDVHVETSHEGIDKILNMRTISMIEYEVTLPNPDEGSRAQSKFKRRLEQQNIRKQHSRLTSATGQSIQPDEETTIELKVAASNGFVSAKGLNDEDKRDEVSTKNHPFIDSTSYDPEHGSIARALIAKTPALLAGILDRFGR